MSLLFDLGVKLKLRFWTDSTASKGICSRQGLGKVRHLDTQSLWIQQRIRNHDLDLYKIAGEENPADLGTKYLNEKKMEKYMEEVGHRTMDGRARGSLRIA